MAAQQLELILAARDELTPVVQGAGRSIGGLTTAVKSWGTASYEAQVKAYTFYSNLRAARAASVEAAGGLNVANKAARDLAKGGIASLLNDVPIVGGALSKLASTLGGFPLAIGATIGAGAGLLKFLEDLNRKATQSLLSVTALSEGIGAKFQETLLSLKALDAELGGDKQTALEKRAERDIKAAQRESQERIAAAEKAAEAEKASFFSLEGFAGVLSGPGFRAKQEAEAAEKIKQARLDAEADLSNRTLLINKQLELDKQKLRDETLAKILAQHDQEVAAAADAVQKQKALYKDLTDSSLDTFRSLGAGFEDVVKSLEVTQFVTKTKEQIDKLNQAIGLGLDTNGRFAEGIGKLTEKMAEALRLGYVPTLEAVQTTTTAVEALATAEAHVTDAGEAWLKSMEGISDTMDEIIRKTREAKSAQDALAGLPSGGGGGGRGGGGGGGGGASGGGPSFNWSGLDLTPVVGSGVGLPGFNLSAAGAPQLLPSDRGTGGGSGTINISGDASFRMEGGTFTAPSSQWQLDPRGSGELNRVPSFDTGGVVPGPPGRPMLAWVHGGEEVVAREATARSLASRSSGGGSPVHVVHIAPGAITISGTVIDQQRAWGSLVETLGQALDSRAQRRR